MDKKKAYLILAALLCIMTSNSICAEFMRGADISVQTRQDADGVVYNENGVPQAEVLTIFKNHDFDWIRIRLFHTPTGSEYGVCQNLAYVTTLAQRVKAQGFKFLLDIHYSDTWADPGQQTIPVAWTGYSHAQLVTAVHDYTRDVIIHLRTNNVMPEMVQIGNEITNGMLWPDGQLYGSSSWANFVDLINAGIAGVNDGRGTQAMPEIMLHIDRGGDWGGTQWFLDNIISRGVVFDVLGQSFYPEWHGTLDNLANCLNNTAATYPYDIVMAEVGDYYTGRAGKTPESQKAFLEGVIQRVQAAPNGKGVGVFYWEPTWVWSSGVGYRALFEPISGNWKNVNMLMGMEAFAAPAGRGTGAILCQWWTGITGTTVGDLTSHVNYPDNPDDEELRVSLEGPENRGDNYGIRMRGYLNPVTSGDYTFWIASDADSELRLSTDDNPANASLIACMPGSPQSSLISLVAGQQYYIEVLHKEGTGDDNVSVSWQGPAISQQVIDGVYLSPCCLALGSYANFAEQWNRSDCNAANAWCGGADRNRDGSVLLEDLLTFVNAWLLGIQ